VPPGELDDIREPTTQIDLCAATSVTNPADAPDQGSLR
jgi:hypothetical protein